ncbi:PilN family type IVB pilus formation outer membrane protein [Rhodanobacter sp. FW106-PBR-R2A-1-13]|uniref:PilN family type IVB pilus formation outer membrane protein n=1 Tax=Rhodanobacter sp. FW106-PBR-R2A-1-13 TaxID=3454845 RepID=UPI0034E422A9
MPRKILAVLIPAALLMLAGCANPVKQSMQQVDQIDRDATSQIASVRGTAGDHPTFAAHEGQWVDPNPIALDASRSAPQLSCNENFQPHHLLGVQEFAQIIAKDCNIPVQVTPDALVHLNDVPSAAGGAQGSVAPSAYGTSGLTLPGVRGAGIDAAGLESPQRSIDVKYSGPLSGLLDAATSQLGLGWKVQSGQIVIFYTESRTFRFNMIPTTTTMDTTVEAGTTTSAGVSGGGGSGGGGGGSNGGVSGKSGTNQSTDVTLKNDPRSDFESTIKSMLSKNGRMGPLTATGTITVTDTPEVLDGIASYINAQNGILTKQVLFNVKVISVTLTKTDNYGINWGLVFKDVAGKYGFNLANSFAANPDSVTGAISILQSATGHTKQFAGSQAVISALAEQGKVGVVTSPSATTLNMQPVIVQVAHQTSYLASSQTSNVASVGSSTALQPGLITSGFNMDLVPDVLADGETILLQYNMSLSSDPTLRTVTSGNSSVELPTMDAKVLSHKVRLRSGETLILSGFEQTSNNGTRQGIGSPSLWLLGGGMRRADQRVVLVVMITPIVTD